MHLKKIVAASLLTACHLAWPLTYQQLREQIENLPQPTNPGPHSYLTLKEQVAQLCAAGAASVNGQAQAPVMQPLMAPLQAPKPTLTEYQIPLYRSIVAALTPILTHYTPDSLLAPAPEDNLEAQLEQAHTIATFLDRLNKKCAQLAPEATEFMHEPAFAQQSVGKTLITVLMTLQQRIDKQLEQYKAVKPQSATIKELKKIATSASKNLEALLHSMFGICKLD